MTAYEMAGSVLGLLMVGANLRVNPLGWPLAIASSLLYAQVFVTSRLYGQAALQLLFIALACWGWWQWLRGRGASGHALQVGFMTMRQRMLAAAATLLAWPVLGFALQRWTDSELPFLDALPTVASITGQLLLARQRVENWAVWLFVNVVSVALFAVQGLWLTVGLYALFAALSVLGWRAWQRRAGPR